MAIKVQCPNPGCGKVFSVKEEHAGRKAKCPGCASPLIIPTPEGGAFDFGAPAGGDAGNPFGDLGGPAAPPPPPKVKPAKKSTGAVEAANPFDFSAPAAPPLAPVEPANPFANLEPAASPAPRPKPAARKPTPEPMNPVPEVAPAPPPMIRAPVAPPPVEVFAEPFEVEAEPMPVVSPMPSVPGTRSGAADNTSLLLVGTALALFLLGLSPHFGWMPLASDDAFGGLLGMALLGSGGMSMLGQDPVFSLFPLMLALFVCTTLAQFRSMERAASDSAVAVCGTAAIGWGAFTFLWQVAVIWKVFALGSAAGATLIPGIGLWVGTLTSLGVLGLGVLIVQGRGKSQWLLAGAITGSVLGILILVLNVKPWSTGARVSTRPPDMKMPDFKMPDFKMPDFPGGEPGKKGKK